MVHNQTVPAEVVPPSSPELLRCRNRTVAKSFYRELRDQGFSNEQIIELSAALLDLVNDDLRERSAAAQ